MPSIDVDELTRRKLRTTRVLHDSCKTGYYSTHFNIYCTTLLKKITCIILTIKLSVCVRVFTLKCQMFEKCSVFFIKKLYELYQVPSTPKYLCSLPRSLLPPNNADGYAIAFTTPTARRMCHVNIVFLGGRPNHIFSQERRGQMNCVTIGVPHFFIQIYFGGCTVHNIAISFGGCVFHVKGSIGSIEFKIDRCRSSGHRLRVRCCQCFEFILLQRTIWIKECFRV